MHDKKKPYRPFLLSIQFEIKERKRLFLQWGSPKWRVEQRMVEFGAHYIKGKKDPLIWANKWLERNMPDDEIKGLEAWWIKMDPFMYPIEKETIPKEPIDKRGSGNPRT